MSMTNGRSSVRRVAAIRKKNDSNGRQTHGRRTQSRSRASLAFPNPHRIATEPRGEVARGETATEGGMSMIVVDPSVRETESRADVAAEANERAEVGNETHASGCAWLRSL